MVIILMGVSGSGKTTIGKRLAADLSWPFYDGDDFHPPANIAKMAQGLALTDNDREPWLNALRAYIKTLLEAGKHAVLTCSALKSMYRARLMSTHSGVHLVHLQGSYALIHQRLEARQSHFMRADLLTSQFETLEEPEESEGVLTVDISQQPEVIVSVIKHQLAL